MRNYRKIKVKMVKKSKLMTKKKQKSLKIMGLMISK